MTTARQLALASTRPGRILLHLAALALDHRLTWHLAGIVREVRFQ